VSIQDTHTDDQGVLSVDDHQDYVLDLVHVTSAGSLVVEFHRQYDTCDTHDDYLIDVSINSLLTYDRNLSS